MRRRPLHWTSLLASERYALEEAVAIRRRLNSGIGGSRSVRVRVLRRLVRLGLMRSFVRQYVVSYCDDGERSKKREGFAITDFGYHVWKYRVSEVPYRAGD